VTYTVADIDKAVEETGWGEGSRGWYHLLYGARQGFALPGIGVITLVHDGTDNDETAANGYYIVFTITDPDGGVRTFKRDGWYASHYGGELDGPTFEVKAVQRVVTFWEESE
jgi:hypothetical protein